ncbi:hypothetical protein AAMO2058_001356100 [Amorphochlora amoebiformis]
MTSMTSMARRWVVRGRGIRETRGIFWGRRHKVFEVPLEEMGLTQRDVNFIQSIMSETSASRHPLKEAAAIRHRIKIKYKRRERLFAAVVVVSATTLAIKTFTGVSGELVLKTIRNGLVDVAIARF